MIYKGLSPLLTYPLIMNINFISVALSFIFTVSAFGSNLSVPQELGNFWIWPFSSTDYRSEYITDLKEDNTDQKQEVNSLKQQLNDKNNEILQLKEKVISAQSTIAEFEEANKALKKREEELIKNEEKINQSQRDLEAKISVFEKQKNDFLQASGIVKAKEGRAEQIIDDNSRLRKRVYELENKLNETRDKYDQNLREDKAEFNKVISEERNIFSAINSETRKSLNLSIYILLAFVSFILLALAILFGTWYFRSQNLMKYPNRMSVEAVETTEKKLEQIAGKQLQQTDDVE